MLHRMRSAGERVKFWAGKELRGIVDTLGNRKTDEAPIVDFTTVTLADILERANAPRFIHYVSMDIKGGEINALKGFPFDKYQIGALTVEHNYQEPKRSKIKALMESHGYKRVHTLDRDDCYVPGPASAAHEIL